MCVYGLMPSWATLVMDDWCFGWCLRLAIPSWLLSQEDRRPRNDLRSYRHKGNLTARNLDARPPKHHIQVKRASTARSFRAAKYGKGRENLIPNLTRSPS